MQSQVAAVGRTTGVAGEGGHVGVAGARGAGGARGSSRSNSRSSSRQQGLMLWQLNKLLSALCPEGIVS
jgi:hypothetical protein